jgi:hypothetical protein
MRSETMSLHYSIAYVIISLPLLAVGALATALGFFTAFVCFFGIVAAGALGIGAALARDTSARAS